MTDKRIKDMTYEERLALPEAGLCLTDENGKFVPTRIYGRGLRGDDICAWADEAGSWTPEYMGPEIGWGKRRLTL